MTSHTTTTAPAPGTVVASRTAGTVQIDILRAVGGFTIRTTTRGAAAVEIGDWCGGQFVTLDEARTEANRVRDAFLAHGSAEMIDHAANLVRIARQETQTRYDRSPSAYTRTIYAAQLAGYDIELAKLETVATKTLADRFITDLTNRYAA